jgi:hypothetical protein
VAFVVQAKSAEPDGSSFRVEKATKTDAAITAVELLAEGMDTVTITDEAGRVYSACEFGAFLRRPSK